jgi:hypothetical protein
LNISLGKPDKTIQKPKAEDFANLQGIIIFDVDWADATGHASLWNGKDCSDHCYFEKATEASIWLLK